MALPIHRFQPSVLQNGQRWCQEHIPAKFSYISQRSEDWRIWESFVRTLRLQQLKRALFFFYVHYNKFWPILMTIIMYLPSLHKRASLPGRGLSFTGVLISPWPDREGKKLQRPNSNFCKPLKKIQKLVRPTRSPRQRWPPRRKKNGDLSIVFLVGSG